MKTVERAHSPKNLWEKVLLSRNYSKALAQLDEHLQYFPKVLQHRNKQRLTKIHQYLLRLRKIKLKQRAGGKAKMVQAPSRKIAQREARREKKALVAAKITTKVEQELVDRLAQGTYGDLYNFAETNFGKALEQKENEELEEEETESESEDESIVEYVEDLESDEEEEEDIEDMEYLGEGRWGKKDSDSDDSDDASEDDDSSNEEEDDDDEQDNSDSDEESPNKKKRKPASKKKPKRKGTRLEIEYEEENEAEEQQMEEAGMAW